MCWDAGEHLDVPLRLQRSQPLVAGWAQDAIGTALQVQVLQACLIAAAVVVCDQLIQLPALLDSQRPACDHFLRRCAARSSGDSLRLQVRNVMSCQASMSIFTFTMVSA